MTYAQRKYVMTKKDRAALSKWANRPQTDDKNAISERQRSLWIALNEFVMQRGGAIASVQFANPVRLEVPLDSELPAKLRELGYDPVYCEQATRIGAPSVEPVVWGQRSCRKDAYAFRTVDVYELRLPK